MSVLVDHESAEVITLTLDKIKTMLVENTVAFEEYVETFLSRLTVLAREGKFMVRSSKVIIVKSFRVSYLIVQNIFMGDINIISAYD